MTRGAAIAGIAFGVALSMSALRADAEEETRGGEAPAAALSVTHQRIAEDSSAAVRRRPPQDSAC